MTSEANLSLKAPKGNSLLNTIWFLGQCLVSFCLIKNMQPHFWSLTLQLFSPICVTQVSLLLAMGKHAKASFLFKSDFLHIPGLLHWRTIHIPTAHSLRPYMHSSATKLHSMQMNFALLCCPDTSINNLNDNMGYCRRLSPKPHWAEIMLLCFMPQLPHTTTDSAWCIMFIVINTCNQNAIILKWCGDSLPADLCIQTWASKHLWCWRIKRML